MRHGFLQRLKGVLGMSPRSVSGSSEILGAAIDRIGAQSAKVDFLFGAKGGSADPTGIQATLKIVHCDTSGGTYTDFAALGSVGSAANTNLENTCQSFDVNLEGAKQFIKTSLTPVFTGGTAPTVFGAASVDLADYNVEPPVEGQTVYGS